MLTPLELSKKTFKIAITGGYSRKEVDEFLKVIRSDYEELYKSVIDMKEENNRLIIELERYRSTSEQLQKALTLAQKTADEIKLAAERQADLTLMQANIRAEQIKNDAIEKLRTLNNIYRQFSSEFGAYLETFMKLLTKIDSKFENLSEAELNLSKKDEESEQSDIPTRLPNTEEDQP
jgi:cell division initiation protein